MNKCYFCGRATKLVVGAGLDECPKCKSENESIVSYFVEEALMSSESDADEGEVWT